VKGCQNITGRSNLTGKKQPKTAEQDYTLEGGKKVVLQEQKKEPAQFTKSTLSGQDG